MANRAAPLALAFALLVGACSSDGGDATATGGETVAADSGTDAGAASGGTEGATDDGGSDGAEAATTDGPGFPSVDVVDLDTGDTVDLGQVLAGSDLPTLLWFWAPHWSVCRREAPVVEQFARQNDTQIRVVGMGAQDTEEEADDFKADGGVETPVMIWDPSFDSWTHYGVRGQPAAILVDADGNELGRWLGAFDLDEVLETLA